MTTSSTAPLLEVRNLKVYFPAPSPPWGPRNYYRAVDDVSFQIFPGETFGLVGESGSGKSTTAKAIVRLVEPFAGEIFWRGQRIDQLSAGEMRPLRRHMQMIFQDPFASLNPRLSIGSIIAEPLDIFGLHSPTDRKFEVMRLMDLVGLNPRFLNRYPHEFSGGQRQRVGIARALASNPELIVCDEPVSALDVSIQAQVVNLLRDLQQQMGLAYLFISHDLSVVRHLAHRVAVLYLGRFAEVGETEDLFNDPRHPYTQALLSASPEVRGIGGPKKERVMLSGEIPSPSENFAGCAFASRCPLVQPSCRQQRPALEGERHLVACPVVMNATAAPAK